MRQAFPFSLGWSGGGGRPWEPIRTLCFGGWINLPYTPHRPPLVPAAFRRQCTHHGMGINSKPAHTSGVERRGWVGRVRPPRTAFSLALCIAAAAVLVHGLTPRSVLAFAERSILSLLM